jgi:NAD(P)-dependent dehydrogenase (short-subunit alcohol dehydrogenase family)
MSPTSTAVPGGAAQWRLDDRGALVTGASTGLGARFARVLHQAGAHVLATAHRADLLDQLARQCGERIDVMPGDITDASHRQALARRLESRGRGVIMLTCALAQAFAPKIAVNSVAPGVIPFGEHDERITRLIAKTPAKRAGTADEIADAVVFFLTASDFITGQVLAVDGGLSQK